MRMKMPCGVEDCEKIRTWLGYCSKHACRFKKWGDPLFVTRPHEPRTGMCSVDGCDVIDKSGGLCAKHLTRFTKHGDVHHNERPQYGTDQITYGGAHLRVHKLHGPASTHACVKCQKQARQWAYDHTDPNQQVDPTHGGVYSTDPAHYVPMCSSCHKRFDLDFMGTSKADGVNRGACSVEGCERQAAARGWCKTHWARWRKHGDPLITLN